jgi:hypothetical protein
MQKDWFSTGGTIRILGQKGGNDYSYMTEVQEGCIADTCWKLTIPKAISFGLGPVSSSLDGMTEIDFSNTTDPSLPNFIYDVGYGGGFSTIPGVLDDSCVNIPATNFDFYFFGINRGATNSIFWDTNNVIAFEYLPVLSVVSMSANTVPAILLGNYDRLCSKIYYSRYLSSDGDFNILRMVIKFSNYYTDITNLTTGQLEVRMIRELVGAKRQFVQVGVISAPPNPGFSNDPTVSYPSGVDSSGNPIDTTGSPIDSTKNSPWDLTNGTTFQNVAGNAYTKAFPVTGTTVLYMSDSNGNGWQFFNNAYLNVY